MEELRFDGRVAIVTGGGNGLGRAHALELARRGARVLVNDIGCSVEGEGSSAAPAESVAQEIRSLGGEAVANAVSATTPSGAGAVVRAAEETFGPVDVVVNSAGIAAELPIAEMTAELIEAHLAVSVKLPMFLAQATWPGMVERRYGRILNTTSGAGLYGRAGNSAYAAGKMGLVGLTKALALEGAAYGIHVNVLAPAALTRNAYYLRGPMRDWFERCCPPHLTAAMAVFLVHESCPANGEIVCSAAGHGARTFIGETRGVHEVMATPEEIRDRFEEICDPTGARIPSSAYEAMQAYGAPALA